MKLEDSMFASAHVVVGGALGESVRYTKYKLVWAVLLGVSSAFVLDVVPHNLPGNGGVWDLGKYAIVIFDSVVAIFLTILLWWRRSALTTFASPVLWGATAAYLVDFVLLFPLWGSYTTTWPLLSQALQIHNWIHDLGDTYVLGWESVPVAVVIHLLVVVVGFRWVWTREEDTRQRAERWIPEFWMACSGFIVDIKVAQVAHL